MLEAAIGEAGTGMTPPAPGPLNGRIGPTRLIRRWGQVVGKWAKERFTRLGKPTVPFEEIVHEFAQTIEVAGRARTVEAALMRQARRMVPAGRLELITGLALPDDQGPQGLSVVRIKGGPKKPLVLSHRKEDPWAFEIPLRWGSACYGRLRIRVQTHSGGTVPGQTVRRLTTLCTMAASAFERLGRAEEWPEHHDASDQSHHTAADLTAGGGPFAAASATTGRLHDATFLNAVLPFALSQARRHHEPLSLVCVAIDRLAGIQELLGPDTADQLVRSVAGTVASLIRGSDIIARLYDDRVVAVLPRAPGGGALHVAQRICQAVAAHAYADCAVPKTTVSIGVATFPASAENVFSLFDAADEALARAQSQGRNQACLAPRRAGLTTRKAHPTASAL
jgi:diguanylate cyclase (GGDEF)-like protein